MTDYSSNRLISEAYQRMCEWTNPNGTIDDRSKYYDACHALATTIMDQVASFIDNHRYYPKILGDLHTFEVGYDNHSDTVYGTYNVGIMINAVVSRKGDDRRRFFTLSHYDIDALIHFNYAYIKDKMAEYIQSHNLAKISDNVVTLKPDRVVIPVDIFDVGTLGRYLGIEGAPLTLKFRLVCDRYSFMTCMNEFKGDGRYIKSAERRRVSRAKSAAFRKNLHAPNFPDRKPSKVTSSIPAAIPSAKVIRNNQTDISDDEILKAVNDALHGGHGDPDIDYDFGEDDGETRYSMFVTVNDEDVEVSWYADDGLDRGGSQDKPYDGSVDWSIIDDARYV